jgi:hypothetical protein
MTFMDIQKVRPLVENGSINGKISSESGRACVLLEATSDQLAKMVRVHSASLFNVSEAHVFSRMENQTDKQVSEKRSQ